MSVREIENAAYEQYNVLVQFLAKQTGSSKVLKDKELPDALGALKEKISIFKDFYSVKSDWTYKAGFDLQGDFTGLYSPCIGLIDGEPHIVWGNTIKKLADDDLTNLNILPTGKGQYKGYVFNPKHQALAGTDLDPSDFPLSVLADTGNQVLEAKQWAKLIKDGKLSKFLKLVVSSISNLPDGEYQIVDYAALEKGGRIKIDNRWYRVNDTIIKSLTQTTELEERILVVDGTRTWQGVEFTNAFLKGHQFVNSLTWLIESTFMAMGQPVPNWKEDLSFNPPLVFEVLDCQEVENEYTSHALKVRHLDTNIEMTVSPNTKLKKLIQNGAFDLDSFEGVTISVSGSRKWGEKSVMNLSVNIPQELAKSSSDKGLEGLASLFAKSEQSQTTNQTNQSIAEALNSLLA